MYTGPFKPFTYKQLLILAGFFTVHFIWPVENSTITPTPFQKLSLASERGATASMGDTLSISVPLNRKSIELQLKKSIYFQNWVNTYRPAKITNEQKKLPNCKYRSKCYDDVIEKVSMRYNVEPAMIKAIILAESSFNPLAVSPMGAKGLMQIMPATASELGVTDLLDPEQNIEAGVRYFKLLLKRLENKQELALAAYNAGLKRVFEHSGIPPYKETQSYVEKVLRYYDQFK